MRSINATGSVWVALFAGALFGCTPGVGDSATGGPSGGGSDAIGGSAATNNGAGSPGGSTASFNSAGGGTPTNNCDSGPSEDADMDGFTGQQGDCNDCDANANPGAIEVIGTADDGTGGGGGGSGEYVPADEDCDGIADNVPEPCDAALALEGTDPYDGARAIELCKTAANDQDWGVISAAWVRANGTAASPNAQLGILENFGPNVPPRGGARVLALSSGNARLPGQSGACASSSCSTNGVGTPPAGFPATVVGCTGSSAIRDDVALEVALRAPTNAIGYKFDFKFTSFEFGEWVCTSYNDQFIALVNPPPLGAQNGNISFDSVGNPVSVNIAFFDVCASCSDFAELCFSGTCPSPPPTCCSSGAGQLAGTGFDNGFGTGEDAGGTSWLQTLAPIEGGSVATIRFAIWDTGDTALDSTAVVDNFQWVANGGTVSVGTTPIPE